MFMMAAPEKVMAACPTPRIGRERFIFIIFIIFIMVCCYICCADDRALPSPGLLMRPRGLFFIKFIISGAEYYVCDSAW